MALLLLTKVRRKQTVFWKGSAKTTRAVTNDILQERVTSLQAPGKWKEIYPAAQLRNLENVFGDKCEKPWFWFYNDSSDDDDDDVIVVSHASLWWDTSVSLCMLHGRLRLFMCVAIFAHLFHVSLASLAGAFFAWTVRRRTCFSGCTAQALKKER